MRGKQLRTRNHCALLVIEEPILAGLETGNDRMPGRSRVFGRMLARRTVAATDVPTLRTPAQMKPPTFRRRQAFDTPIATRLRSRVNSVVIFLHFEFSFLAADEVPPPFSISWMSRYLFRIMCGGPR